jgi:type IV fimbrial biogenesis protein FimT
MERRNAGFTLLELVVTIAVLGIVLGLGIPSFSRLAERVRTVNTLHGLTASFAQARMEAIRRNTAVAVCPSADGRRCTGGTAWETGWILFTSAGVRARRPRPPPASHQRPAARPIHAERLVRRLQRHPAALQGRGQPRRPPGLGRGE